MCGTAVKEGVHGRWSQAVLLWERATAGGKRGSLVGQMEILESGGFNRLGEGYLRG